MVELDLAGVGVERDHRRRVEVVARPRAVGLVIRSAPVVERRWVGRAPPHRIGLGIVGAGHPATATAGAPGLVAPGLLGVRGAGDGEEFPDLLTGLGTVSYTHLRAHETRHDLVCRLLLEKKKITKSKHKQRTKIKKNKKIKTITTTYK